MYAGAPRGGVYLGISAERDGWVVNPSKLKYGSSTGDASGTSIS
jgi:hypothetical protein